MTLVVDNRCMKFPKVTGITRPITHGVMSIPAPASYSSAFAVLPPRLKITRENAGVISGSLAVYN